MLTSFFQAQPERIFSIKQIFHSLKLNTHPLKMLAIDVMEDMAWDDFLSKAGENAYMLNTKGQVQEGTFIRKANGKNTFQPDDGGTPVFVSERNSMSALNGDRVKVQFMARRRNHIKEAMVIEILQRRKDTFVGKLKVERDFALLITQENMFVHDIIIPKKKLKGGTTGDRALVQITKWPDSDSKNLIGEVIDVLGKAGDNDVEMNSILAQYGLPYRYPKRVEEAAEKINAEITEKDIAEREDFRDVWTCTIDPKDAKDFDDALSLRQLDKNLWQVGVHIADVSHYVKEGYGAVRLHADLGTHLLELLHRGGEAVERDRGRLASGVLRVVDRAVDVDIELHQLLLFFRHCHAARGRHCSGARCERGSPGCFA